MLPRHYPLGTVVTIGTFDPLTGADDPFTSEDGTPCDPDIVNFVVQCQGLLAQTSTYGGSDQPLLIERLSTGMYVAQLATSAAEGAVFSSGDYVVQIQGIADNGGDPTQTTVYSYPLRFRIDESPFS